MRLDNMGKKKRQSKSWYVKIKGADEREVRVTGVTTPEAALGLVVLNEGEEAISARPVRKFKPAGDAPVATTTAVETPAVETGE